MSQTVLPQRLVQPAHQPQVFLLQARRGSGGFCAGAESSFTDNTEPSLASDLKTMLGVSEGPDINNNFKVEAKLSSFSATRFYPNPSRVEKWRCDYNFKTMHKSSDFIFINRTSFRKILVKFFISRQCLLVYDL